jgi:glycosyltransferase involved in cell wall biosynthesis
MVISLGESLGASGMADMRVKLALSTLCENPCRRTGLSSLFHEFVAHARLAYPEVSWLVFLGRDETWPENDAGIELCRDFPANDRPLARIFADHFRVAPEARRRGASALLTVGFYPLRPAGLPVAMQVFAVDSEPRTIGGMRSAYRRWAVRRGLDRAALVITNSLWAKSRLARAAAPVLVSPEGVRHDLFTPEGTRGAPGVTGPYLLWASNFYSYKRVELVLAAYAHLSYGTRAKYRLVLAGGEWSGGRGRAEAEARRLGIAKDVLFLGWVDDEVLPALYRGARAHVLSTSHETFGRSVLESLACGCPNVIQDLPVLREVAGDSALYVDYGNAPLAARQLESICSDDGLRERLGASGLKQSERFSFERLARERVGAILDVLGNLPP